MPRHATSIVLAVVLASCTPVVSAPSPPASPSATAAPPSPSLRAPPASVPAASPSLATTPTGPRPSAVRFVDADHGWLGMEDGILGTNDGGRTWSRQLTAGRIGKIWSFDATRAWALAADNTVYRTQDGTHWTAIQAAYPPIVDLDPFSPTLVWAIGVAPGAGPAPQPKVGNVLVSDDGGLIWRSIGTHTMWSICFDTQSDGIGAEGKQIFRTSDAGRTWTPLATLPINDRGPWYPTLTCPGTTSFRVQVTEPYAALGNAPYLVFRTTDSGQSWVLEFREGYTLGTTTPRDTPGLGSYPSIIGTLPGGNTWILTCSPAADAQELLIVDPAGTIISSEKAPFVSCARDATFVDARHGWAIDTDYHASGTETGSRTRAMRTTDGSRTWQRVYPP